MKNKEEQKLENVYENKMSLEFLSKSENEARIQEAYDRLAELDRIKEKEVNEHKEFLKDERERTDKNISV